MRGPAAIYCHGENAPADSRDAVTQCRSCGRRLDGVTGPGALECAACRAGAPLPMASCTDLAPSAGPAIAPGPERERRARA